MSNLTRDQYRETARAAHKKAHEAWLPWRTDCKYSDFVSDAIADALYQQREEQDSSRAPTSSQLENVTTSGKLLSHEIYSIYWIQ